MTGKEIYKQPAVKTFHDHAKEYDNWFEGNPVYEMEVAALKSLQTEIDGPKMEIGVGPGRFARDLGITFGIDPAWAPLILACKREIKCCQAVGEFLPVKDGAIGTIYVLFTLCFADDPQKILSECFRALKEGGHLIIGMVPSDSAWGRSLEIKKKAGHAFYKYASFYLIETVEKWLTGANMNIVERRSTLYQSPECVEEYETPEDILDKKAGFIIIVVKKDRQRI